VPACLTRISPRTGYHGFVNTSDSERAVMVWCYGGAASLEAAGYIREVDDVPGRAEHDGAAHEDA
jgi:hypothetical protein